MELRSVWAFLEALMQEEKDGVVFDCQHFKDSVHHQADKEGGFSSVG